MTYPNLVYPATPFPTDSVPTLSADLAESGVSSFTTTPPPAWWAELDASGNPLNVPLGQSGPFLVQIDEEQILCSSVSDTGVLAIVVQEGPERGYNETTPAFHEATSKVYLLATSAQNAGAGGISTITSTDGSVTVTDPTGPSTDLSVVKVNGISYFIGSGSPVGVVTPNAAGDQYIDNTPGPSWQATGTLDTDWQQVGGGGGPSPATTVTGPDSFGDAAVVGTGTKYARDDHDHGLPAASPASFSGAGVDATTGVINQSGGMVITDTEDDGFTVNTNVGIAFGTSGQFGVYCNGLGEVQLGGINPAVASGSGLINLPLVVAAGVNDTFIYTPAPSGPPEVFTVAPGSYATNADVINALNNATGTMSDIFYDWGYWSQGSNFVYVSASPGDEISDGPTSILPSLNMNAGPYTLGPSADKLSLWGATAVTQQTITGALSTVVDPAAKAVLTSLLAALSATAGYGLVIDGTT